MLEHHGIVQKNISIMAGLSTGIKPAIVGIGNFNNQNSTAYDLNLLTSTAHNGNIITQDAQVILKLDSLSWQKWIAGGKQMGSLSATGVYTPNKGIRLKDSAKYEFVITDSNVYLKNLTYPYLTQDRVAIVITFPDTSTSTKDFYTYDLVQTQTQNHRLIGGVRLEIHRNSKTQNKHIPAPSVMSNNLLAVWPNLASSSLHYEVVDGIIVNMVTVKDVQGRIYGLSVRGKDIDISSLSSGMYLLVINTDKGILSQIFVKE